MTVPVDESTRPCSVLGSILWDISLMPLNLRTEHKVMYSKDHKEAGALLEGGGQGSRCV